MLGRNKAELKMGMGMKGCRKTMKLGGMYTRRLVLMAVR
jgi:hypothetical protein